MDVEDKMSNIYAPKPILEKDNIIDLESGDFEFRYVLIDQIYLDPIWNIDKYEDNHDRIKSTGQMVPIILSFNDDIGKYELTDGIHRTHSTRDLGYTHIPAIIGIKRIEKY